MPENDDMSATIVINSDQLNAEDLISNSITVTVQKVVISNPPQPVDMHIDGGHKPFRPCLTMRKILKAAWGASSKLYAGRSMTLFREPTVTWGTKQVGGVEISHLSNLSEPLVITLRISRIAVKTYTILPLIMETLPAYKDESIRENLAAWKAQFNDGKGSPERLINAIEEKFTLTDAQKTSIRGLI